MRAEHKPLTNQSAVTHFSLLYQTPTSMIELIRTIGSTNQNTSITSMTNLPLSPHLQLPDLELRAASGPNARRIIVYVRITMQSSHVSRFFLLHTGGTTDHLIGTTTHAHQRPMVTYTEMIHAHFSASERPRPIRSQESGAAVPPADRLRLSPFQQNCFCPFLNLLNFNLCNPINSALNL
ncbi:hypothetical protein TNCV_2461771 [Trichonephila clavipes]|nr:hypothetical protein TNCV_2461771 [Trichonephila clavipes]